MYNKTVTLSNGVKVPMLGLGTLWSDSSTAVHPLYITAWCNLSSKDCKSGAYEDQCRG